LQGNFAIISTAGVSQFKFPYGNLLLMWSVTGLKLSKPLDAGFSQTHPYQSRKPKQTTSGQPIEERS
jgi:hypothetical protein